MIVLAMLGIRHALQYTIEEYATNLCVRSWAGMNATVKVVNIKSVRYLFVAALIGVGTIVTAALAASDGTDSGLQADGGRFLQPTVVVDSSPMLSLSSLTRKRDQEAIEIALADSRVQQILGDRSYNIVETILWTGSASRLMGVVVRISLDEPSSIGGPWLALSWSCDDEPLPPPEQVPFNATFDGVTGIEIFASVNTDEVDQILPFSDGDLSLVGEREFTGAETSITTCYDD